MRRGASAGLFWGVAHFFFLPFMYILASTMLYVHALCGWACLCIFGSASWFSTPGVCAAVPVCVCVETGVGCSL
jgi:hypothetical protein